MQPLNRFLGMLEHSIRDVGFNFILFPTYNTIRRRYIPDLPDKGDFKSRTSQEARGVEERKRSAVLIRNDLKAQGFKVGRAGTGDDVLQRDMWGVSRYSVGWNSDQVAAWHVQSLKRDGCGLTRSCPMYGIWGNIC